jgi:hypothetical protein
MAPKVLLYGPSGKPAVVARQMGFVSPKAHASRVHFPILEVFVSAGRPVSLSRHTLARNRLEQALVAMRELASSDPSRELSLAITKSEESAMWLGAAGLASNETQGNCTCGTHVTRAAQAGEQPS